MNEKDPFSNIQRHISAVMAKSQWTSLRISMQTSGKEIYDRRIQNYQKTNKFLQELICKRSDISSFDDNGTLDRYYKFRKYKTYTNDNDNLFDEFNRRLCSLNNIQQKERSNNSEPKSNGLIAKSLQATNLRNKVMTHLNKHEQTSKLTMTPSFNTRIHSVLTNARSNESEINPNEYQLLSLEQFEISTLNNSTRNILHKPKARRIDNSEIIIIPTDNSLQKTSTNALLFKHCHFPRSLLSHKRTNTNLEVEKNLSSSPIEQYDQNQLFYLLDRLDNHCSSIGFTKMLDQLTLSTIQTQQIDNNISLVNDNEYKDEENIVSISSLFDSSLLSSNYYEIFTFTVDNLRNLYMYTMTIGIVQLNSSCLIPYSILNGRRPYLQTSMKTNFKPIRSKQQKYNCQVTAIESLTDIDYLKENDIILKINDQSVSGLTTDVIRNILHEHSKQSNHCLLTIVRLCQPFI